MGAILIVPGLSLILTVGILSTFLPLKATASYVDASGPQYMTGMSERSWVLLWRITDLVCLTTFVILCSYVVRVPLLRPYYYGF